MKRARACNASKESRSKGEMEEGLMRGGSSWVEEQYKRPDPLPRALRVISGLSRE